MSLGFTVADLLPVGRSGARLSMGLSRLAEPEWLFPAPDLAARATAFDAHPDAVQMRPEAMAAGQEVAAMVGAEGGLEQAARAVWEDMCLLNQRDPDGPYVLTGGAVAFPTDWCLADKIGLPLIAMHAPIYGYAEQLATGVDRFLANLAPGPIFGRANWFVVANADWRYLPGLSAEDLFADVTPDNAGERLFVRCERQTLRRLPTSGAILFTIGIAVSPLGALDPALVRRLAAALAAQPEAEQLRRGTPAYAPALAAYAAGLEAGE
jgi:hypothetical protein